MDDCWEPWDAPNCLEYAMRPYDAAAAEAARMACLHVVGPEDDHPVTELPGTAEYLWVLWSGDQPSRDALIDIYKQFPTSD